MTPHDKTTGWSTVQQMVRGSTWMIGWRWGARAIGLLSTLVLARLLTPEDFGIVAMAMAVVGFLEVVADACHEFALMRLKPPTREHFDAAWTIQFIAGCLLAMSIVACAPLAVLLFDEPRASTVMYVLAIRGLLIGMVNVGIIQFRIELDFQRDFAFGMLEKLCAFVITLICAALLRNYWALVLGMVGAKLGTVVLSYVMHPFRPRFSLRRAREIWSFSSWIFMGEVTRFVTARFDELVVGRLAGPAEMGRYAVASDVATAPTMEIISPTMRAFYPIYTSISIGQSRQAILDSLSAVTVVSLATAVGIALVADDFVAVALGARWTEAAPLVRILALSAISMAYLEFAITALNARLTPRSSFGLILLRLLLLIGAVIAGWFWGGVIGVAAGRTCMSFGFIAVLIVALRAGFGLLWKEIADRMWRPVAASGAMAASVLALHPHLPDIALLRLVLDSAVGAAVYGGTLLALWHITGGTTGIEAQLVKSLTLRLNQRRHQGRN